MPLLSAISDIYSSLTFSVVHAESPPAEPTEPTEAGAATSEKGDGEEAPKEESAAEPETEEPEEEGKAEAKEEEAEEEEEEEEEEDEEPKDLMPELTEECAETSECKPHKHHFDECVERVTAAQEDANAKGPKEDCVEEFFHLAHCTGQCAAPKLFSKLK